MDGAQLQAIAPKLTLARATELAPFLLSAMAEFRITSPRAQAAFVATCAHESQEFTRTRESLYFLTPERIVETWPKRFASPAHALPYVRNASKLANYVYGSRMGNGAPATGDGWKYRGAGWIMLTGKDNFSAAGVALVLPLVDQPELVERVEVAARTAGWFWASHKVNEPAELGDMVGVTKIVNGGLIGLDSRLAYYRRAGRVFGAVEV